MSLRLIVMRHGQAEEAHPRGDRRRTLTVRGHAQAAYVASEIARNGWTPGLILTSDAERAHETAEGVKAATGNTAVLEVAPDFYLTGFDRLAPRVARVGVEVACILVVGHNPGWSDALYQMTGKPLGLSPADAAVLEHTAADWSTAFSVALKWSVTGMVRASFTP